MTAFASKRKAVFFTGQPDEFQFFLNSILAYAGLILITFESRGFFPGMY